MYIKIYHKQNLKDKITGKNFNLCFVKGLLQIHKKNNYIKEVKKPQYTH